jgi:hypothetical protein
LARLHKELVRKTTAVYRCHQASMWELSGEKVMSAMRKAPAYGTDYWRLTPTGGWLYTWTDTDEDFGYLRNGLAFADLQSLKIAQYGE